jgi:hypothetical protein
MAVSCSAQSWSKGAEVPCRPQKPSRPWWLTWLAWFCMAEAVVTRVGVCPLVGKERLTLASLSGFAALSVYRTSRMNFARCPAMSSIGTMRAWSRAMG